MAINYLGSNIRAGFLLKMPSFSGHLYHLQCGLIFNQQKIMLSNIQHSNCGCGTRFRPLFLVAIVFIVVLKDTLNWLYGVVGLILLGILLMLAVRNTAK